jgi:hypothetical protein
MDEKVRGAVAARGPGGVFTSSQIARQLQELEDDVIAVLDDLVADGWLRAATKSVEWTVGETTTPPVTVTLYRNPLA